MHVYSWISASPRQIRRVMLHTIFEPRLGCDPCLDSLPDMYRAQGFHRDLAHLWPGLGQLGRKRICRCLDNNRGNYLGDNNSRSSTGDSCRTSFPLRNFGQCQFLSHGYKLLSPERPASSPFWGTADFCRVIPDTLLTAVQMDVYARRSAPECMDGASLCTQIHCDSARPSFWYYGQRVYVREGTGYLVTRAASLFEIPAV